jgi:phasin family protein
MANPTIEQIAKASADPLRTNSQTGEKIANDNAWRLAGGGSGSSAAAQDLINAYQELATRNAKTLTAAIQALSVVKSPAEFMELQQRLIKDGADAAIRDGRRITELTTSAFAAAFEATKRHMDAMQKTTQN